MVSHSVFARGCDRHETHCDSQRRSLAYIRTYQNVCTFGFKDFPILHSLHLQGFICFSSKHLFYLDLLIQGYVAVSLFFNLSPVLKGFRVTTYRHSLANPPMDKMPHLPSLSTQSPCDKFTSLTLDGMEPTKELISETFANIWITLFAFLNSIPYL